MLETSLKSLRESFKVFSVVFKSFSRDFPAMGNQTSKNNKDRSKKNVHWKSAGNLPAKLLQAEINRRLELRTKSKENQTEKSKNFPFRRDFTVIFSLLNVSSFLKISAVVSLARNHRRSARDSHKVYSLAVSCWCLTDSY